MADVGRAGHRRPPEGSAARAGGGTPGILVRLVRVFPGFDGLAALSLIGSFAEPRSTRTRGIVDGDRVVGRVRRDAYDVAFDCIDQIEGSRRVIDMPLGQTGPTAPRL